MRYNDLPCFYAGLLSHQTNDAEEPHDNKFCFCNSSTSICLVNPRKLHLDFGYGFL